ncbi:MAG: cation-translocating P-type ATPase [Candidatus Lokiarchaeota archaeon]|nr:cation-translocating P-type ATPase [Candidatus Lokiarchaeota archaeon]
MDGWQPPAGDQTKCYLTSTEECLSSLGSAIDGLPEEESKRRLGIVGENKLKEPEPEPAWKKFLAEFNDFLVWILIGAAIFASIEAVFENQPPIDAIIIAAILILNATIGFLQDRQAEQALAALKKMSAQKARVVRGQDLIEIFASDLVPGDVVALETGDQVPADLRIIETMELKTDEASLTGESMPVKKETNKIDKECTVGDRINMAFSSTVVAYGRGKGVVVATGMGTEVGKIATALTETEEEETPLTKKIDAFGKVLGKLILIVCGITFVLVLFQKGNAANWEDTASVVLQSIMASVALAVAAIPEGLPAITTTALALGVKRMAKRNAIVRKLPAVETLGCTTVICSDKTGTLTKNEMTIRKVFIDGEVIEVSGTGYEPAGDFFKGGNKVDAMLHGGLQLLARVGVCCNNATLRKDDQGRWVITGDPTEAAFLTLAGKLGTSRESVCKTHRRVSEVFFSSERKKMSTVDVDKENESYLICMKGGLEPMLSNISSVIENGEIRAIKSEDIDRYVKAQDAMSSQALRVLGCAYKELKKGEVDLDPEAVEKNLILVGLVGMIDPPRAEVKPAVEVCKGSGIKTVMITGDHAITARAIAQELGILPQNVEDGHRHIVQGTEIDQVSDKEICEVNVFARVSPEHKMRIVKVLQEDGNIVSMTGDGVNDAPALKKADAGVAMGITGTDVAKGAANIVLADDNFASIVAAVEEGRAIYANMKRFINFLLGCNFAEIGIMFVCALLLLPVPLEAIHLLWVNLLTDGLPALAMGFEKADSDIMVRPPRPPTEPVITRRNTISYIISTGTITLSCILIYFWGLLVPHDVDLAAYGTWVNDVSWDAISKMDDAAIHGLLTSAGVAPGDLNAAEKLLKELVLEYPRTLVFTCMVVGEMYMAINCRSETMSVFQKSWRDNWYLLGAISLSIGINVAVIYIPPAAGVFRLTGIRAEDWLFIVVLDLIIVLGEEVVKVYWKKTHVIHYVEKKYQW